MGKNLKYQHDPASITPELQRHMDITRFMADSICFNNSTLKLCIKWATMTCIATNVCRQMHQSQANTKKFLHIYQVKLLNT